MGTGVASLHAKGREAINLRPWWRISITLNNDPEAMLILPPLDQQISDKLIILRASPYQPLMPTTSPEHRAAYAAAISSELPAFSDWLINSFSIPDHLRCPRYNIATFHHPELAASLRSLSPECDLMDLIDQIFFQGPRVSPIEKSAIEIEAALYSASPRRAEKILTFRNACGTYLGRLQKQPGSRVSYRRTQNDRFWVIQPPSRFS